MSTSSKSVDKKRFAGIKTNDLLSKTRPNDASRATGARTQGWTNLGKVSARRIPPPANLPSLKSETGTNATSFDSVIPSSTSHNWTASGNQAPANLTPTQTRPLTPSKQPTQQQLDSLPANISTPPPPQSSSTTLSSENEKPRVGTTWSTVTTGNAPSSSNDQPPNLLGLNDFPRLATQESKSTKSQSDTLITSISTTTQGPSFRPANLSSWKEGGGRAQPLSNDLTKESNDNNNLSTLSIQSTMLATSSNSSLLPSQIPNSNNSSYMRMHPQQQQQQQQQQQMWSYNIGSSHTGYGTNQTSAPMPVHQLHHQQRISSYGSNAQSQQRLNTSADYKTPTILRNKDIDDLSKLTDNVTWASAPQEVNYEEKIRFSDDEDNDVNESSKTRRFNNSQQTKQSYPQVLQNNNRSMHTNYSQQQTTRSRLLQDDEHVKQMQDDKNSELISTLTVAKQRRDEQERNIRDTASQRSVASSTTTSSVQKSSFDDQKQMPGYQTRPLMSSTGQDNVPSPQNEATSSWGQTNTTTTTTNTATMPAATASATIPRTRRDTTDSQTFAMKSWSDQMDSFNYASLHEKSGAQGDNDDHHDDISAPVISGSSKTRKYSRSPSESSTQSQTDNRTAVNRSKDVFVTHSKQTKSNVNQSRLSSHQTSTKDKTSDFIDYFDNNNQQTKSNDHWGDWDDGNTFSTTTNRYHQSHAIDRRHQQPNALDDMTSKSNRHFEQTNDLMRTKQSSKARSTMSRSADTTSTVTTTNANMTSKAENRTVTNKTQPPWRPLSPPRPSDSNDPTPKESVSFKGQAKSNNETNDRRQSAPIERKTRYTTPIDTTSIPPLMSVRSDVPPPSATTTSSKHFKTSSQSQKQDYTSSSHYSQRNDYYNEVNDATWGNDDEYYDDETGYYDSTVQTHQRHHHSMGYTSNAHHRGYIALGSYGRYRRGGVLRHQQQYSSYGMSNTSGTSPSQLNTSTGSKTKKNPANRSAANTSKKPSESLEQKQAKTISEPLKTVTEDVPKKPSAWTTEKISTPTETQLVVETLPATTSAETDKSKHTTRSASEQTTDYEATVTGQTDSDATAITTKQNTTNVQKKTRKDQQNYHQDTRYQSQQTTHRNNYTRSLQSDYDSTQMTGHNYYGTSHRTTRGARSAHMQDLTGGYYYDQTQQHYNNRYSYSNERYKQPQTHGKTKTSKRIDETTANTDNRQYAKQQTSKGNNSQNLRLHSASDNEQKEGEEWETASESSTNMRPSHADTHQQQTTKAVTGDIKSTSRDKTPPKKSFASQRPVNARHNDATVHRRAHNVLDRTGKVGRTVIHRTSRSATTTKHSPTQKPDAEASTAKQMTTATTTAVKKDQHRHSLEGYDLNNVAGVVKIETLPASALEEESSAIDDGGEEFCLVMSKRGRKEQKAAQLSKQNATESGNNANGNIAHEQAIKSTSTNNEDQTANEKNANDASTANTTRTRSGKSVPPRFNGKTSSSTTRQHNTKADHQNSSMYYYDQNYYYYDQNQYYDQDASYYNYGNYNQSHRQTSTRRKQRNQQSHDAHATDDHLNERKADSHALDKNHPSSPNVMSNIQMWDPHTDSTISKPNKLIEKPSHDRKFTAEVVPSSSTNDSSLPHHQRAAADLTTHSTVSKTNDNIARAIKPPVTDGKSTRDNKTKSSSYDKNNAMSSLESNQLFEKGTFLDYDDKQSIGAVGDDYNQKINSLKTIWDASDHSTGALEQTINTMVVMKSKQQQDSGAQNSNATKTDNYVQESMSTSSAPMSSATANVSSTANDDLNNKNAVSNVSLQSTGSSSTINQPSTYSASGISSKNEQKNICTVKPTQQVPPNIQDPMDVSNYQTFTVPPLLPAMSQPSIPQQHLLSQSQVNPLHQQHSYPFYDSILSHPPPPPQLQQQQPPPQQQQQQFNRIYSSTTNTSSSDPINSDFSSAQSSQIYPQQNFTYRSPNMFMPPPNVPNTNSMYHHTSQAPMTGPPQNNAMPLPPMPNYQPPFVVDHGAHTMSQPQPPPSQLYMGNQMMSGRPQGPQYYRMAQQQQLQTPPGPPFSTQDPLSHGGFYHSTYIPPPPPPPNSNAPPVGHPSPHNLYGQNEAFHSAHPPTFPRAGSMDRTDHPLLPQPPPPPPQSLSRPTSYPSTSSTQQQSLPPPLLSQNIKPFQTTQPQSSSSNPATFYPLPNQYPRQPMPIGAMNTPNNRQQTQQVPSLMSGLSKFSTTGSNINNASQSLHSHRPSSIHLQSNNNRALYSNHPPYSNYSTSTGPNDDNLKPKKL